MIGSCNISGSILFHGVMSEVACRKFWASSEVTLPWLLDKWNKCEREIVGFGGGKSISPIRLCDSVPFSSQIIVRFITKNLVFFLPNCDSNVKLYECFDFQIVLSLKTIYRETLCTHVAPLLKNSIIYDNLDLVKTFEKMKSQGKYSKIKKKTKRHKLNDFFQESKTITKVTNCQKLVKTR